MKWVLLAVILWFYIVMKLLLNMSNFVYHVGSNVEIDCHIVHEKIVGKEIQIGHCSTEVQLSDFLTKAITEK